MILKTALKKRLTNAERVVLLGVGSELRGDDAAGLLVANRLKAFYRNKRKQNKLKVLLGNTAPENLTGEIRRLNPSHVIIIDTADTGKKAGTITLIKPQQVGGISFSTHQLPLSIMVRYLRQSLNCQVIIIGIQPKRLDFDSAYSKEVEKSAKYVSDTIKEIISGK